MSKKKPTSSQQQNNNNDGSFTLPERIEKIYYTHGLFCSSHPVPVICFASFVIIICCYPLVNVPLPSNTPQEYTSSLQEFKLSALHNATPPQDSLRPLWYEGAPVGYVLQIVVRCVVLPGRTTAEFASALRTPIKLIFEALEVIRNYQYTANNSVITIDDVCLHVSESIHHQAAPGLLPHYGCLIVSPTNFWRQDFNRFSVDNDLLKTLLEGEKSFSDSQAMLKEILFGVTWKETNVGKLLENRPKPLVITQAITLVLTHYETQFIEGLQRRLHSAFTFNYEPKNTSDHLQKNITHVYFHDQYNLIEFIPLIFTYIVLFFYIYFSVRKIELVKSKLGMAFSAVVTVVSSLGMSIGICTWFGLSFTPKSGEIYLKEIFPYLVVIIGLENILVLTKSVVSTSVHLDVKVRLAQGLSKEGWSITKNLCTELTILTFGYFTFVPAIQEFCMFAVVGLLSDFFLQLGFFATVLSIDIRRMELSDLQKQSLHQGIPVSPPDHLNHMFPLFQRPVISAAPKSNLKKSRSSTRLSGYGSGSCISHLQQQQQTPRIVTAQYGSPNFVKVPKRLRLAYFWARCRIFQRAFMVTFVVWLMLLTYKSGVVEHFGSSSDQISDPPSTQTKPWKRMSTTSIPPLHLPHPGQNKTAADHGDKLGRKIDTTLWQSHRKAIFDKLHKRNAELWKQLSSAHWPVLFGYYNMSLYGRYISFLPSIVLPIPIDPNEAIKWHHVDDEATGDSEHVSFASILEQMEKSSDELEDSSQEAIYPSSTTEMILTFVLAIPSVIFVVYLMIVLYRCICTRNYAEWRSSWSQETQQMHCDVYTQLVMEAMPIVLEGHPQEIECMTTDGMVVVSSCLAGQLRVWDSSSGECLSVIDRHRGLLKHKSHADRDQDDVEDVISDYESGSPPSKYDFLTEHGRKHLSAPSVLCAGDSNCHSATYQDSSVRISGMAGDIIRTPSSFSQEAIASPVYDDCEPDAQRQELFRDEPTLSLSSTITTDFSKLPRQLGKWNSINCDGAYDFSRFGTFYAEMNPPKAETKDSMLRNRQVHPRLPDSPGVVHPGSGDHGAAQNDWFAAHEDSGPMAEEKLAAVWCLDCQDSLITAGCNTGRIEIWDANSGDLKCVHDDGTGYGVTGLCIVGSKVVAARLHGGLDFLELKPGHSYLQSSGTPVFSAHRRMHVRQGSGCSSGHESTLSWEDDIVCAWVQTTRAHQQPITELRVEGGRAVTGSQDHSLKVFCVEDAMCQLTLHGHHGPITTLFIDKFSPMTAASGAQDGAICLWDLSTGACICRLQGHDGAVAAVTYTAAYVLSAGVDTRLLVWERFQGHLLNTIYLQHCYCSSMVMLTDNLLLTARQGSLVVWDIRVGEPVRIVRLGHSDQSTFVRQIQHVGNAVVCDYGNQLRVVQFPTIVEKDGATRFWRVFKARHVEILSLLFLDGVEELNEQTNVGSCDRSVSTVVAAAAAAAAAAITKTS